MQPDIDYADDPSHPIPSLDAIDVHLVWKSGGSDLVIVIASPMRSDERSMNRLLRKVQVYLEFINSAAYDAQCGPPKQESTRIVVGVHDQCDRTVFDALEQLKPWVQSNRASLKVTSLDPEALKTFYPQRT